MSLLLDTSVLIDLERGVPAAIAWAERNGRQAFFVSAMSVFEFHLGAVSPAVHGRIAAILDTMSVISIDAAVAERAADYRRRFHRSHGVGVGDALIAATALVAQLPLLTLNTKHFPDVPKLARPYGPAT